MLRDPSADIGRRAWVPCPRCLEDTHCGRCQAGLGCPEHWRFLLDTDGRHTFVQCPGCGHRWWHDTRFGAGGRRQFGDELRQFPPHAA